MDTDKKAFAARPETIGNDPECLADDRGRIPRLAR